MKTQICERCGKQSTFFGGPLELLKLLIWWPIALAIFWFLLSLINLIKPLSVEVFWTLVVVGGTGLGFSVIISECRGVERFLIARCPSCGGPTMDVDSPLGKEVKEQWASREAGKQPTN